MNAALHGGECTASRPGRNLPPGKDPVPILQEAGWASWPVWTVGMSRPHRDSIQDRPFRIVRRGLKRNFMGEIYIGTKVVRSEGLEFKR